MSFRSIDSPNVENPEAVVATETTGDDTTSDQEDKNLKQLELSSTEVLRNRFTTIRRSFVINRSGPDWYGRNSSRGSSSEGLFRSSYSAGLGFTPEAYKVEVHSGVGAMVESRDKEKKDMQDLNERFVKHVDNVRHLEAQNKNLAQELKELKKKWGYKTSQVKAMYQVELDEARTQMNDAVTGSVKLEVEVASLEDTVRDLSQRLDDALAASADWKEKWELSIQREMRFSGLEAEKNRYLTTAQLLQKTVLRVRSDLKTESCLRIEAENRAQSLEEELEFLKAIHEQEMKEMSALANRDHTQENRAFWKNEMGKALREIQQLYNEKFETMQSELKTMKVFEAEMKRMTMELYFIDEKNKKLITNMDELKESLEIQCQRDLDALKWKHLDRERELENENETLRTDTAKLRTELEAIMEELRLIVNTKIGLELEIATYRKLLELEEEGINKKAASADSAFGKIVCGGGYMPREYATNPSKLETSAKEKYSPVIWSKGQRPFDSQEPEADFNLRPSGNSVTTKLLDSLEEERATYVQRSV